MTVSKQTYSVNKIFVTKACLHVCTVSHFCAQTWCLIIMFNLVRQFHQFRHQISDDRLLFPVLIRITRQTSHKSCIDSNSSFPSYWLQNHCHYPWLEVWPMSQKSQLHNKCQIGAGNKSMCSQLQSRQESFYYDYVNKLIDFPYSSEQL